jgi:excisionase family DNA binding protein
VTPREILQTGLPSLARPEAQCGTGVEAQLAQIVRHAVEPMLTEALERLEERLAARLVAPQPPELLSQADVAKYLRVVPRTVARMQKRGELPEPVRFGGCVRWRRADLDALMEAR